MGRKPGEKRNGDGREIEIPAEQWKEYGRDSGMRDRVRVRYRVSSRNVVNNGSGFQEYAFAFYGLEAGHYFQAVCDRVSLFLRRRFAIDGKRFYQRSAAISGRSRFNPKFHSERRTKGMIPMLSVKRDLSFEPRESDWIFPRIPVRRTTEMGKKPMQLQISERDAGYWFYGSCLPPASCNTVLIRIRELVFSIVSSSVKSHLLNSNSHSRRITVQRE